MSGLDGKRILVIDDDPYVLRLLEHAFSMAGASVCAATSGEEGLRHLRAHQPHLVILDIIMPGLDGWEVCHRIRQSSHVPIIFLSALGDRVDIDRGLQSGAADYITKPFDLDDLLARTGAAFRRSEEAFRSGSPVTCSMTDGD